jgi:hypothetical protein
MAEVEPGTGNPGRYRDVRAQRQKRIGSVPFFHQPQSATRHRRRHEVSDQLAVYDQCGQNVVDVPHRTWLFAPIPSAQCTHRLDNAGCRYLTLGLGFLCNVGH